MSSFPSACQQHTRDAAATTQLISNESSFSSFLGQFAEFLEQYKRPYSKGGVFRKNPQKVILEVLKSVTKIIEETKSANYQTNMAQSLERAFTLLLHPENAKKVRETAVTLFFTLMDRLELKAEKFLENVAPLVFNFRLLEPLTPESNFNIPIDQTMRLNLGDVEKEDLETLWSQIKFFTDRLCKYIEQEAFIVFLPLFRVMLLDVAYPPEDYVFGIKGPVPEPLQERILSVMAKIVEEQNIFKIMYELKDPSYKRYFFATARECRRINENPTELAFIEHVFGALYGLSCQFIEQTPMENILEAISVLLNGHAVMKGSEIKDGRKRMWDQATLFVADVATKFQPQELSRVVELFVNWQDTKNLPTVLTLILGVLLCHNCEENMIWDIIKRGPKENETRSAYWTVLANFASYYAVSLADCLLGFDLKELQRVIGVCAPLDEWLGSHKMWTSHFRGFTKENREKYFREHEKDLSLKVCPDIFRLTITSNELSPSFLDLLLSLKWMDCAEEKEQWDMFSVPLSFVVALVRIAHVAPTGLDIDVSFIFDHFFPWMMRACEPSVQHKTIIGRSLETLGMLIHTPASNAFLSDDVLSSWYSILLHHVNSRDSVIQKTALFHACKSVVSGLKGSHVLHDVIIEKSQILVSGFQLPELFYKMRAPIELYNMLTETVRGSAIAVRMMIDVIEGKTEYVTSEVDMCIELLEKFDIYQVFRLRPVILLLTDKLGAENDRIMDCIFKILEKPPAQDSATYEQYAIFACCLVVYCASEEGLRKLEAVSKTWTSQSLHYHLLMTAMHFKRYPKYTEGGVSGDDIYTCFKTTGDHILSIADRQLVSSFPPGCRVWSYAPENDIPMEIPETDVEKPKAVEQKDALEFEFQSEMCGTVERYMKNVFEDASEAASPSDFEQMDCGGTVCEEDSCVPKFHLRREVDSPGPVSTNFASSLGFFEPIENKRLFPAYAPLAPYRPKACVECIHVGISSCGKASSHFEEFKTGLGFVSRSDPDVIVFRGLYGELIFHTKPDAPCQKVQIVWSEGMDLEEMMGTFSEETQLRLEVSVGSDGEFGVDTHLHRALTAKKIGMKKIRISKKILPMFIIARIQTLVHVMQNGMQNPLLEAAVQIRKITEHNFYDQDDALSCERSLLNKGL